MAIETQAQHLGKKKTWTRKIVLVTDGQSEIELEDWEATVDKMNDLDIRFTVVLVSVPSSSRRYSNMQAVASTLMTQTGDTKKRTRVSSR